MTDKYKQIEEQIARGEIKKAEITLARLLRSASSDQEIAESLIYRARLRLITDRPDEALADLKTAQERNQAIFAKNPELTSLFADAHLTQFEQSQVGFADRSDITEAQTLYHTIMEKFPDYDEMGWITYQLGRIALIKNDKTTARLYFQKSLSSPSKLPTLTALTFERMGFLEYYEERDARQAITYLDKALHTYPESASALWLSQLHLLRSRVLRELNSQLSIEAVQQAIDLITGDTPPERELIAEASLATAELYTEMEYENNEIVANLQRFFSMSKRPLGVDVTWSRAYEMLGDAYTRLELYDKSITAYQFALQHNPYHPWEDSIRYRIARSHYRMQDYDQTVDLLIDMLRTNKESNQPLQLFNIYNLLGNAYFAQQKYALAAEVYAQALEKAPAGIDITQTRDYLKLSQQQNPPL